MAARPSSRVRVAAIMLGLVGLTLAATPASLRAQFGYAAETPSDALARHMKTLATDQRNFQALIGAGRAALQLGDTQSAAGFFGRAEEVWPTSPMPQIGKGAALAAEGNGAGALPYFARAQQLGAGVVTFGLERGLAYDLLGRHSEAQSDYRAVLGGQDGDEARRRLALSLAISGNRTEAISTLGPLMAKGDAAGARVRALVLALTGDTEGAKRSIEGVMPGSSYQMAPFFQRLPGLRSDQKAAAVHLGIFPGDGTAIASANIPQQQGDRLASIDDFLKPAPPQVQSYTPPPRAAAPAKQPVRMASNMATNRAVGQQVSTKRFWVQLASGPNPTALPGEFRRLKARHAAALKDLSPYIAETGDRSRLLIGPFKDREDASIFA